MLTGIPRPSLFQHTDVPFSKFTHIQQLRTNISNIMTGSLNYHDIEKDWNYCLTFRVTMYCRQIQLFPVCSFDVSVFMSPCPLLNSTSVIFLNINECIMFELHLYLFWYNILTKTISEWKGLSQFTEWDDSASYGTAVLWEFWTLCVYYQTERDKWWVQFPFSILCSPEPR